jgi:hypothetical protein
MRATDDETSVKLVQTVEKFRSCPNKLQSNKCIRSVSLYDEYYQVTVVIDWDNVSGMSGRFSYIMSKCNYIKYNNIHALELCIV